MQNKGAITLLAVALALVSLYQLFFTYKTNQVENAAKEFANGNPIKENGKRPANRENAPITIIVL